jgi:hypothetical protein
MTALATFPSPREISALLSQSSQASEPCTDLGTLEQYYKGWPYPKSLDSWEGFVYADLCEQVGWAYLKHEEFAPALAAWRECPWPSTADGERQALAQMLQAAYEDQSLVIGPPVADLVNQGRIQLGLVLSTLDDSASQLFLSGSGMGYVVTSRVVKPEGLYHLRFEFDPYTIFYVSFLPAEVHHKLSTARTYFQMGEAEDCARWLLRAAFVAMNEGLDHEAMSFLQKAEQLSPNNQCVQQSLTNLRVSGVGPTLASRVVVERSLAQPEPLSRCAVRPSELPACEPDWVAEGPRLPSGFEVSKTDRNYKVASLGVMPLDKAKRYVMSHPPDEGPWPLILPVAWDVPSEISVQKAEKRMSLVRGVSVEKLGLWRDNFRPVLTEMMSHWPEEIGREGDPEVVDFALPDQVKVGVFGCSEFWQIPTLLELNLTELKSEAILAAWWRRLNRRWGARPFLLADDIIWFQMEELPEGDRRELFLADLINMSHDVAECFEPTMIKTAEEKYLFPVPLQLTFKPEAVDAG